MARATPTPTTLRDLLDAVRRLGFVVELLPDQLVEATTGGAQLDVHGFVAREVHDTERYQVSSVSVPVFAADGSVALALNLAGFTGTLTGREVRDLAAALQVAAARCG